MRNPVTLDDIDTALAQCAELIERYPRMEKDLWLYFDRLEAERETMVGKKDRLAAAKARVKARSQGQTETRFS